MAKKKKLTPLQKEYNKEYRNYQRRLKTAQEAGFVIPEKYLYIKKEKPRKRDIEQIRKITRKKLQSEYDKGKVFFVDVTTGEILEGNKPYKQIKTKHHERPTSFKEAIEVINEINQYIKDYKPPESSKEFLVNNMIKTKMQTRRGPDFDWEEFKDIEEKEGWLFKDPNRPLEPEEINYIQDQYDSGYKSNQTIGSKIEDIRGWNTDFNYYDKFFNEQVEQTGLTPWQAIEDYAVSYEETEDTTSPIQNKPKTIKRKGSEVGSKPIESIVVSNMYERINNLDLTGESYSEDKQKYKKAIAKMNKVKFRRWMDKKIAEYGEHAVEQAILNAENSGRAFQVYFAYNDDYLSEYLSDLEDFLIPDDERYIEAEEAESWLESGDDYDI